MFWYPRGLGHRVSFLSLFFMHAEMKVTLLIVNWSIHGTNLREGEHADWSIIPNIKITWDAFTLPNMAVQENMIF